MLTGQEKTFLSLNSVQILSPFYVTYTEYLDKLHSSGLPPQSLVLKQGTIVILF